MQQSHLKFEKVVKIEPEYQGHTLYIVLDKVSKGSGVFRYFPVASSALPFNPELKRRFKSQVQHICS